MSAVLEYWWIGIPLKIAVWWWCWNYWTRKNATDAEIERKEELDEIFLSRLTQHERDKYREGRL